MEAVPQDNPEVSDGLGVLRKRIADAHAEGGSMYRTDEILDLLALAERNLAGYDVSAELLIRAMRNTIFANRQAVMPLDNETATTLINIADGTAQPAAVEQVPTDAELGLIA